MRNDLTDITVVLDRSGSMQSCKADAEGGLNHFIEEQKSQPDEAVFTLVQFDTEYEFVHRAIPIKNVPSFKLEPRGSTALLDAVGRAINETGRRLAAMPEEQRPGLVVFVILTDGEENSSREFTKAQILEMITHQTNVYSWQFVFLASNQDAFAEAGAIGIARGTTAGHAPHMVGAALRMTAGKVARARACASAGAEVDLSYSDSEREALKD